MTANRKLKQQARALAVEQDIRYPDALKAVAGEQPYPPGSVLSVVAGSTPRPDWASRVGTEFEVSEYVPADQAEDGIAFYSGWGEMGTAEAPASHVVLVRSAEQQANRAAPTLAELTQAVSSAIHGVSELVEIDQTDHRRRSEGVIHVEGRTHDGLLLSFTVTVSDVEVSDRGY